jgi:hypothetical protein
MDPNRYVTQFDSASCMLYALAHYLHGRAFTGQEGVSRLPPIYANLVNALPVRLRKGLYIAGGVWEAIPVSALRHVQSEGIAAWVTRQYPVRRYPAMLLGSSNGAATHLAAMLGAPWLPQTVLVASRRRMHPDEMKQDLRWGMRHIRPVLDANPDLQAHQMHDPLQDRLMVSRMAYFRMKRLRLGRKYRRFIEAQLAPGGTLIIVDCKFAWPVKRAGERHVFQVGGLGGIEAWEYLKGSPRIAEFLKREGSSYTRWETDEPDADMPEAEWGFVPELAGDIKRLADERGYRVVRLSFEHPEAISEFVADFHWDWYRKHGTTSRQLMAECFGLVEPWWALRTRTVPLWLAFNAEPSAQRLEAYLAAREPFDQVFLSLISNGVKSIGLASMERWQTLIQRARKDGKVIGIHESKYPMDIGSFVSYDDELKAALEPGLGDEPPRATLDDAEAFLSRSAGTYRVSVTRL